MLTKKNGDIILSHWNPISELIPVSHKNLFWELESRWLGIYDWLSLLVGDILMNNTLTLKILCIGINNKPYSITTLIHGALLRLLVEGASGVPSAKSIQRYANTSGEIFIRWFAGGDLFIEDLPVDIYQVISTIESHQPDLVAIYGYDVFKTPYEIPHFYSHPALEYWFQNNRTPVIGTATAGRKTIAFTGGDFSRIKYNPA